MSLINKMLQDLDARANTGGGATDLYTKPIARRETRRPWYVYASVSAAVVLVAAGGALGWKYFHKPAPAPVQVAQAQPLKVVMLPSTAAPAAPVRNDAPPAPQAQEAPADEKPVKADTREDKPRPALTKKEQSKQVRPLPTSAKAERNATVQKAKLVDAAPAAQGRQESASQKAESAYRRALASLQDGWTSEAIASLEQALQASPRHEAARQTLVGLLIENKHFDDAMRHLQLGLAQEPRQPAMAMLLARLQIERGGTGIETLVRTLPYAAGNGEYHAFLAGALQRQQRHHEAAEQYGAALRTAPHNGVWWMGLGISLQADKRDAEALEAFRRAKASGVLNQDLLAFVERKIRQLGG